MKGIEETHKWKISCAHGSENFDIVKMFIYPKLSLDSIQSLSIFQLNVS